MRDSWPGFGGVLGERQRDLLLTAVIVSAFASARLLAWLPLWVVATGLVVAALSLRPKLLLLAVLLLIGARAGAALDSLDAAATRPVDREVVRLIDDPRPQGVSWRAQVMLGNERVTISARAPQAGLLRNASAGDDILLSGTVRGRSPETSWAISRRIVGQLSISTVHHVDEAGGAIGAANVVRDTIRRGVGDLSHERRVLFTGLVFGDDRGQNVIISDNFRAAGLGHLLAVSGQNVVFVLLLAAPLLSRFRRPALRFGAALVILAAFGFLTRFEPSVSRALVMAGLAILATGVGRPAEAAAVLPPTVLGLLLFDPLLAWSLAFQLSVAATLGLIVLTPRLADGFTGPQSLRLAAAATLSAQLFVAPLLFHTFGHISLVAVPANLLAAPAAAGVMMWGLVVGPIAGIGPPGLAMVLHLPTRMMLWWIDTVASISAQVDLGRLTGWHLIAASIGGALWFTRRRTLRPMAVVLLVGGLGTPLVVPHALPAGQHRLVDGVVVVRSSAGHDVVLLGGSARLDDTIESLRRARLGRIDLLIVDTGSRQSGRTVGVLTDRFEVLDIWAPPGHQVPNARTIDPVAGQVGSLVIRETLEGEVVIEEAES